MRPRNPPSRIENPVLSLVLFNALGGAIVALAIVGAFLALDIGRLGTLIGGTESPAVAVALLSVGFVITFASAAIGSAIMRLGQIDGRDRRGGGVGVPVPIRVRAVRRR